MKPPCFYLDVGLKDSLMLELQVIHGIDAGKEARFRKKIVSIGAANGNDFRLNDDMISEQHGEFVLDREGRQYSYSDLRSQNGSRIRSGGVEHVLHDPNVRQSVVLMQSQSLVAIGRTVLRVNYLADVSSFGLGEERVIKRQRRDSIHSNSSGITNERYRDLIKFTQEINASLDRKMLLQRLSNAAFALISWAETFSFFAFSGENQELLSQFVLHRNAALAQNLQQPLKLSPSLLREILETGDGLCISLGEEALSSQGKMPTLYNDENIITFIVPVYASDHLLGLLQLEARGVKTASIDSDLDLFMLLCSIASSSLERVDQTRHVIEAFNGFIKATITAIDARDPNTAGHSMRVANYAKMTALAINQRHLQTGFGFYFSKTALEELVYASLFHDIGKIMVPDQVLQKSCRLHHGSYRALMSRIDHFNAEFVKERQQAVIGESTPLPTSIIDEMQTEIEAINLRFAKYRETVERLHLPQNRLLDGDIVILREMRNCHLNADSFQILLHPEEEEDLLIPYGSLNSEERRHMEQHPVVSWQYLSKIPWPAHLKNIPTFAHQHHEKLNGTGYPLGLKGDEILFQSRIITICDIFDALTAGDRPYKERHSFAQAAEILEIELQAGALDPEATQIFLRDVLPEIKDPSLYESSAFPRISLE